MIAATTGQTVSYWEIAPHPALRDWVKCYWVLRKQYASPVIWESILPDGCIDLIFYSGGAFYSGRELAVPLPNGALIGPLNQPLSLFSQQQITTFGVRFFSYGLYPFLRLSPSEIVNQIADVRFLFDGIVAPVAEMMAETNPNQIARNLDDLLFGRLAVDTYDAQFVKAASRLIGQHAETASIGDIAAQMGTTPRTLQRKIGQVTGFSPKMLARIIRFNRLKNDLMHQPFCDLTALAYRYAYFDQAHFIHGFRQFTGVTPSAFIRQVADGQIRFYR